ncbi:MAG: CDP-diacylglycerol--glycerol-3-phosphate 3-phosphatidyltransferase, partial [Ruminococcaceae bacterium]|nr:CDP-diacylglycerol--glycerol-3-phosphate 3-phosphatidyltransferase [Oscillospiraceae bacterium]
MNLPNKLTLLRVFMIPTFMVFIIFGIGGEIWSRVIAAILFVLASITDMIDGHIARKYNLITDMGKFLDPLADKLLIFGAFISILVMTRNDTNLMYLCAWAAFVVIF